MNRLASLSLLLLLTRPLTGQEAGTAAAVTEPGRTMERALDVVLAGADPLAAPERTLVLLVDATASLQKSGFADALATGLERHAKALARTRIGIAKAGSERLVVPPTDDRGAVLAGLRETLAAPSKAIQNVYADLRALVPGLAARGGARQILLATLDNGDAEDDLEGTVARLEAAQIQVHVLTSEAYVADSFWAARPYERAPRGTRLAGGDSAFIDLPWGWLFQITAANEVAPSGYACYALARVAAATGGRVFLFTPADAANHQCAIYGACLFCSGDHIPETEVYWDARVRLLAPSVRARPAVAAELGGDPWQRATAKAWREAASAGVLSSQPPRLGGTASGGRSRADRGTLLGFTTNLERNAEKADQTAKECERILAAFEAELARIEPTKGSPRQRACAEFTRLLLQLTKVNLISFAGWCRDVAPGWMAKDPPDPAPPERAPVDHAQRAVGIGWSNYSLCHGARPFLEVELPGGPRLREELLRLDAMIVRYHELYAHTPFAVALHRQGVARFHLTYPGIAVDIDRQRPKSKNAPDPVTVTESGRPPRAGATGAGAGPSGPTTGSGK
ncbi:MAG: VWA domain-containing protein [Planctomycetes bacterium]|nr:VWA domain-containing protein [Planctomycetota bacterium]